MKSVFRKQAVLSLATTVLLGLSACGGGAGSSSGDTATGASYSGIGIDGIIVGATVCIDANRNNACDVGEPSAITDENGTFNIAETTVTGPLVLVGGYDKSLSDGSGGYLPFTGTLKAPAGSKVVSPLTSAVQALVESGQSAADAQTKVKTAMGLGDVDVDLTTFDPYNGVSNADTAVAENAKKVLAQQTKLQVLVHTISSAVAGADANNSIAKTMSTTFAKLASKFSDANTTVELDETVVKTAVEEVAAEEYADNEVAKVSAQAVAITTASVAVVAADRAEETITNADVAEATAALDSAISNVNDEVQTKVINDVNDTVQVVQQAVENNTSAEDLEALLQEQEDNRIIQTDLGLIEQYTNQTFADFNATQNLAYEYFDIYNLVPTAELAWTDALAIKNQVFALAIEDLNITYTNAKKLEVKAKAEIAAGELVKAIAMKEAILLALELKRERIANAIADMNTTKNELQTLFDVNVTGIKNSIDENLSAINALMEAGYNVESELGNAQASATSAFSIYTDANSSLQNIYQYYEHALSAQSSESEVDINSTKILIDTEANKFNNYIANAFVHKSNVDSNLTAAQGIKIAADEAAAVAQAAILASKIAAQNSLDVILQDASDGNTTTGEISSLVQSIETTIDGNAEALPYLDAATNYLENAIAQNTLAQTTASNAEILMLGTFETNVTEITPEVAQSTAVSIENYKQVVQQAKSTIDEAKQNVSNILLDTESFISNYAVEGRSENVANAITTMDTWNIETTSLTTTLTNIRGTISTDTENKDEKVLLAILDILDILNSETVTSFIDKNTSLPILDVLIQDDIMQLTEISEAATTAGGTDVMHAMAEKLVNASNVLAEVFTNEYKVVNYGDRTLNVEDAKVIRAHALFAASALDLFASYSYGDIDFYKIKEKEIEGISYEYIRATIDPLSLIQQPTFFALANSGQLEQAGVYLRDGLALMSSVDVNALSIASISQENLAEYSELESELTNSEDSSFYTGNVEKINLAAIFSTSTAVDRSDFVIPTTYLGRSDEAIIEFDNLILERKNQRDYETAQCLGDTSGVYPSSDINYTLIYSEPDVPVDFNLDLSIVAGEPVHADGTNPWYTIDENCTATIHEWRDSIFNAKIDVKVEDSLKPAVTASVLSPILQNTFWYIADIQKQLKIGVYFSQDMKTIHWDEQSSFGTSCTGYGEIITDTRTVHVTPKLSPWYNPEYSNPLCSMEPFDVIIGEKLLDENGFEYLSVNIRNQNQARAYHSWEAANSYFSTGTDVFLESYFAEGTKYFPVSSNPVVIGSFTANSADGLYSMIVDGNETSGNFAINDGKILLDTNEFTFIGIDQETLDGVEVGVFVNPNIPGMQTIFTNTEVDAQAVINYIESQQPTP